MTGPPPSPKSRLRPVHGAPDDSTHTAEPVLYQLEDLGDPALRLRPTLRIVAVDGVARYLYRVEAFSRLTHENLGRAERLAPEGSAEEFVAASRQFQSPAFRAVIDDLCRELDQRYAAAEEATGPTG